MLLLACFFYHLDVPQVRVFTYLIGRDMTFAENVKWIACNNKGEFYSMIVCICLHTLLNDVCFRLHRIVSCCLRFTESVI